MSFFSNKYAICNISVVKKWYGPGLCLTKVRESQRVCMPSLLMKVHGVEMLTFQHIDCIDFELHKTGSQDSQQLRHKN